MTEKKFKITAEQGLHARPATQLTQVASQFDSQINLSLNDKTINLKSIMGVMSLAAGHGDVVTLTVDGSDADQALDAIKVFLIEEELGKGVSEDEND